jgi:hypothetical protein
MVKVSHLIHLTSCQPNSSNPYSENSINRKRFQDVKDIKNVTIKFNAVPFDTSEKNSVRLSDSENCAAAKEQQIAFLLRHVDKCPVCCPDMQAGVLLL